MNNCVPSFPPHLLPETYLLELLPLSLSSHHLFLNLCLLPFTSWSCHQLWQIADERIFAHLMESPRWTKESQVRFPQVVCAFASPPPLTRLPPLRPPLPTPHFFSPLPPYRLHFPDLLSLISFSRKLTGIFLFSSFLIITFLSKGK